MRRLPGRTSGVAFALWPCWVVAPSLAAEGIPPEAQPTTPAVSIVEPTVSPVSPATPSSPIGPSSPVAPPSAAKPAAPASPEMPAPSPPVPATAATPTQTPAQAITADARHRSTLDGVQQGGEPRIMFEAGLRNLLVFGGGYEPYAERAMLWSFLLGASTTLAVDGPLSIALGLGWELAASHADVRRATTDLLAHRFLLVPEVRYQLDRRWMVFGRLGVGAASVDAELDDPGTGLERSATSWVATADAGVGLALRLGRARTALRRGPRFWLCLDAGYLWSSPADLQFSNGDAPARTAPIRFEELSLHGTTARFSARMAF